MRKFVLLTILSFCLLHSYAQDNRLWASYYGGTGYDDGNSIATDAAGNIYLAGATDGSSGMAFGGFQNIYGGGFSDAFLVKFDPTGNRLWASYYGGTGQDAEIRVTTDAGGNVYVAGTTTSTSSIASGGFQNTYGGGNYDAFLVKFDSTGNRLWATYYGGSSIENNPSVATDADGNVYLAGYTYSTSGIASGGFQNTYGGGGDAFLVKFDSTGNRLWATYYGGTDSEYGECIATDAGGNVYLAGSTRSNSVIASNGFQNTLGGQVDAFLVKFDPTGNRLWASYYGGTGQDVGNSIATDATGNVYVAGETDSPDGIASGGFQNTFGGSSGIPGDAFLVKFDSTGNRLWASYYGGTGDENRFTLATDAAGNVCLAGSTRSNSSIASGGFQNTIEGTIDAFLVTFDSSGNRLCASYYGGIDWDFGFCIATDADGSVYLAGHTYSTSGIASGGFQNTYGDGGYDAYLVKFTSCGLGIVDIEVENEFAKGVLVYPNPASSFITVAVGSSRQADVKIFNTQGQLVAQCVAQGKQATIEISALPQGIYFLSITDGEHRVNRKFVKE